ncbi:MAG: flagellar biosynthesis anti-sigma factor FlgM [Elusimicrobiales bacterium]|nr:flagellar biosynthesis anti-sigma factor FlgM [Elusimicrobiales bacterium]
MVINEVNSYINELSVRDKKVSEKNQVSNKKTEEIKREDSRPEKIERIKNMIDSGNYSVNCVEVAKKILGY